VGGECRHLGLGVEHLQVLTRLQAYRGTWHVAEYTYRNDNDVCIAEPACVCGVESPPPNHCSWQPAPAAPFHVPMCPLCNGPLPVAYLPSLPSCLPLPTLSTYSVWPVKRVWSVFSASLRQHLPQEVHTSCGTCGTRDVTRCHQQE
jgi:hypothetical protein